MKRLKQPTGPGAYFILQYGEWIPATVTKHGKVYIVGNTHGFPQKYFKTYVRITMPPKNPDRLSWVPT